MALWAIAEQSVSDPNSGLTYAFSVDPADTSIMRLRVTGGAISGFAETLFRFQGAQFAFANPSSPGIIGLPNGDGSVQQQPTG